MPTKANVKNRPGYVAPAKGIVLNHGVYTERQLYELARSVGLSPARAVLAAAIAMAESGGNPRAVSSTGDYGLWQINRATWGGSISQLQNPAYNAQQMAKISKKGKDWSPWSTFKNGAYRKYLRGNLAKSKGTDPQGPPPASGTVTTSQGGVQNLPSAQAAAFEGGLPLGNVGGGGGGGVLDAAGNVVGNVLNPLNALNPLGGIVPGVPSPANLLPDVTGGSNPLSSLIGNIFPAPITDAFRLFNHLFEPQFWIKVGKVVLGIIAVYIGLNALLKISTGVDVTRGAKHAAGTAAATAAAAIPK